MIDPIRLQALVDGECSSSERRALLAACEDNPMEWRNLALAFLEEQEFAKGISVITPVQKCMDPTNPNVSPAASPLLQGEPFGGTSSESRRVWSYSWGPVLAACLVGLAAFLGGRAMEKNAGNVIEGAKLAKDSVALPSAKERRYGTEGASGERNRSLVSDSSVHQLPETDLRVKVDDSYIPIFNPRELDPSIVMAMQELEIQKANQKLRRQGFEIYTRPEYLTGQLQDGRQLVVPRQQVGLRPYGQ
jgi:hypothetical protein